VKTQNVKPNMDNENYLINRMVSILILCLLEQLSFFGSILSRGGLVIIPNKNEPNLVRGHTFEYIFLRFLPSFSIQ
jgi:hypothetical protein